MNQTYFRECPDGVVFRSLDEPKKLKVANSNASLSSKHDGLPDFFFDEPINQWNFDKPMRQSDAIVIRSTQNNKKSQVRETHEHFDIGHAFAPSGHSAAWLGFAFRSFEEALVNQSHIIGILQVWANQNTREVRPKSRSGNVRSSMHKCLRISEELEQGWELGDTFLFLPFI